MMPAINVDKEVLSRAFDALLSSGQYSDGVYTKKFEEELEEFHNAIAVAYNSCGTALEAILSYFVFRGRKSWLVSNNTFYATGASVISAGGSVVLGDADISHFGLSVVSLKNTPDIDGVVLTHIGGQLHPEYKEIADYCRANDLILLEDAAHAVGVKDVNGNVAGSLGAAAALSFYATKAVPVGDGGAVITSNKDLAEYCFQYRNYAKYLSNGTVNYSRRMIGGNYRISEWNAAIGYFQMRRLSAIMNSRAEDAFSLSRVVRPLFGVFGHTNWYKFVVVRDSYEYKFTNRAGQVYRREDQLDRSLGISGKFPNCEVIADNHICLPLGENRYGKMSVDQILEYLRGSNL